MNINGLSNYTLINNNNTQAQKSLKTTEQNDKSVKTDMIENSAQGQEAYLASANQANENTTGQNSQESDALLTPLPKNQQITATQMQTASNVQNTGSAKIKNNFDTIEISAEGRQYQASLQKAQQNDVKESANGPTAEAANTSVNDSSNLSKSASSTGTKATSSDKNVDLSAKAEAQLRVLVSNNTISQAEMNTELPSRTSIIAASAQ